VLLHGFIFISKKYNLHSFDLIIIKSARPNPSVEVLSQKKYICS